MNLDHLRIFREVGECANYSRAAERLYLSQPYVYVQMRHLEQQLGCKLFDRVRKKVVLTQAGRILMDYASQMLNMEGEAVRTLNRLKGIEQGLLTIGAGRIVADYLIPPLIVGFKHRFPGVEFSCITISPSDVIEPVLRFQMELAFIGAPLIIPGTVIEEIWRTDLVLCVGPTHPLAHRQVSAAELANEVFIWHGHTSRYRKAAEQALGGIGVGSRPTMVLDGIEAIKGIIKAGYGVALLPRPSVRNELAREDLVALTIPDFHVPFSFFCIRHEAVELSVPASGFLELARESGRDNRGA